MKFHPLLIAVINTIQFQRLRNIKQLGFVSFVYPSANHTRFEHSLGTCHLAKVMIESLQRNTPNLIVSEKDLLCVQLAALCHDLGHGPFSHSWEHFMSASSIKWNHEKNSVRIFEEIIKEENVKSLLEVFDVNSEDIKNIEHYILGTKPEKIDPNKYFLYQIVHNTDTEIDVDKFEYLLRDSKNLNICIHFDYTRLMHYCFVFNVNGRLEICFHKKVKDCIYELFQDRLMLHKKAYQHLKVRIIEKMFSDALLFCEHEFELKTKSILAFKLKIDSFLKLTDHIFYEILNTTKNVKSREILKSILSRKLYKVREIKNDEFNVSSDICIKIFMNNHQLDAIKNIKFIDSETWCIVNDFIDVKDFVEKAKTTCYTLV